MPSSANIHLRALEPEDLELMYEIENDERFWAFGTASVPYSRYALREYINTSQNDLFADKQVRQVIVCEDTAVGFADLANFDALHMRAEIGVAVLPEYQGRHIGHAALEALCRYAARLHLHQLYAVVAVTNRPAARLFERLAFKTSAQLEDWIRGDEGYVDALVWQKML